MYVLIKTSQGRLLNLILSEDVICVHSKQASLWLQSPHTLKGRTEDQTAHLINGLDELSLSSAHNTNFLRLASADHLQEVRHTNRTVPSTLSGKLKTLVFWFIFDALLQTRQVGPETINRIKRD